VRQDDPILEKNSAKARELKALALFGSDFGRGTKPCYDPILEKTHDDFLSFLFRWDGLYPPSEIVCSSQNPTISIVGVVLEFTNEV
jgi:hypothetical protein